MRFQTGQKLGGDGRRGSHQAPDAGCALCFAAPRGVTRCLFQSADGIKSGARGAAKIPVWLEEERLGINPMPGIYKGNLPGHLVSDTCFP
jgi:hypothetical protein